MAINENNLETKVIKVFYHYLFLGGEAYFARAIKSPCKSFGEGNEKGKGDRPRQMKRPAHHTSLLSKKCALSLPETT